MSSSLRVRHPLNDRILDEKLSAIITRVGGEEPREISPRSGTVSSLGAELAQLQLVPADRRRSDRDRLEQLERELAEICTTSAPNAWRAMRRQIRRLIRTARLEIRAAAAPRSL